MHSPVSVYEFSHFPRNRGFAFGSGYGKISKLSEEDRQKIVQRYIHGEGLVVIGKNYGISATNIWKFLKRNNVTIRPRFTGKGRWTEKSRILCENREKIIADYLGGKTLEEIGEAYGFTGSSVAIFLRKAGVTIKTGGTPNLNAGKNKVCTACKKEQPVNKDFFPPRKFYRKAGVSIEFSSVCRICSKERQDKYRRSHQLKHDKYVKDRMQTDVNFRLRKKISARVRNFLKLQGVKKTIKTIELLGCDIKFFKQYIEGKFLPGMTWDNYGFTGWHLDHIRPLSSFNLINIDEQRVCFHYTNMQPLWAKDNLSKSSLYNGVRYSKKMVQE